MRITNNKGITLVEIIIVLAIISILVSITMPKINNTNYKLKSEARLLCNEIRLLRLKSMTENGQLSILIYSDNYQVLDSYNLLRRKDVEEGLVIRDNFSDGQGSNSKLKFNYNGRPNYAGTIEIRDISTGKYMEITIMPVTGRVLLYNEIRKP